MSCIKSVKYELIVNGKPTKYFSAERVLRHGCALSPLILILVMDCLSLILKREKCYGFFEGMDFSTKDSITHSIFFDDLLVFERLHKFQWIYFQAIFCRFGAARDSRVMWGSLSYSMT